MEEVDKIIMESLSDCGCDFASTQQSLAELSTNEVVEGTVRCLKIITPDLKMSHTLPPGMSARFRIGNALANACKNAGYKGEVGYQTFLYSSEVDLRHIFMFLVEKLPRKKDDIPDSSAGKDSMLKRKISQVVSDHLKRSWVPSYCRPTGHQYTEDDWPAENITNITHFRSKHLMIPPNGDLKPEIKEFFQNIPFAMSQCLNSTEFCCSLLERNSANISSPHQWSEETSLETYKEQYSSLTSKARDLHQPIRMVVSSILAYNSTLDEILDSFDSKPKTDASIPEKSSRFANVQKLIYKQEDDIKESSIFSSEIMDGATVDVQEPEESIEEEDAVDNVVEKIEEVHLTEEEICEKQQQDTATKLEDVSQRLEKLKNESKKLQANVVQIKSKLQVEKDKLVDNEKTVALQEKMSRLLANPEENLEKLKDVVETSAKRIASLGQQWEKHRIPLIEEYRKTKLQTQNKEDILEKKLEEARLIRDRMKECAAEDSRKEQLHQQLVADYAQTSKSIPRHTYTKRIMEIVSNIRKQKKEIENVLAESKGRQKDINNLHGRAERTFTASDELMFKDAKQDDSVKQCYKYLVSLHTSCANLITTVEDAGAINREIRDLEDQIETETKNDVKSVLENITKDYKEMKSENVVLIKKYKKLTNK